MRRGTVTVLVLALATGCADGAEDVEVVRETTVPSTGPTDDLAPSQLTAETAVPPDAPPPCEPSAVSIWTAQVLVHDGSADAVLRVRNDGPVRCEVDVGGSPLVDPFMEPDGWLDPGDWADLVVGSAGDGCDGPAAVRLAQLDVNGERVVVETAAVVSCGWQLAAFFPISVGDDVCDELDVAAVREAVVVRNAGVVPCRLGSLVSVAGLPSAPSAPDVAVPQLAPGDVVAFGVDASTDGGAAATVLLEFDSGVAVEVEVAGGARSVATGPPRPWIGGPGSPTAEDPASLLAALDPFDDA